MIIKFKAYACMKDKECGWKRIEESIHETEIEAKKAALHLEGKYPECETGIHKYYIFRKEEWKKEQHTGVSNKDGRTKTWMTNDENGCVLLFERMHFEIL